MHCVCLFFMSMVLPIKWSKCGNIKGLHMHHILSQKYCEICENLIPKQNVNKKIGSYTVAAILRWLYCGSNNNDKNFVLTHSGALAHMPI